MNIEKKMFNFQWHITDRCNLRCRHCYQSEYRQKPDEKTVLRIAEKVCSELKDRSYTTCINLTGGEPLLEREVLFTLMQFLENSPQVEELMIITNGLLLDDDYLQLLQRYQKLSTLKLSLEGATAWTNDPIRGKGTFQTIVDRIRLIQTHSRFATALMFTLQKNNVEELESMFILTEVLGINGLILERFIPEGQGKEMKDAVLGKEDWKKVLQRVIDLSDLDATPDELIPYRAFWVQTGRDRDVLGALCNLNEALCIMPDGTLYPCRRFVYPLGNILSDGLWSVLDHSVLLQKVRDHRFLEGKCQTCQVPECYGCRALSYSLTRNPFHEDFQCFFE
ncbi:MAG: radical SAM protein [Candidatus Atribacteria bacterium]|nr:radical SAM protein [Candidatus Atribacteria bacterium]